MTKFRWYYDKDAETAWLNEMAAQGYALTSFFAGFYTFDRCIPGEYEYQIDASDKFNNVSNDYREFMTDAGIEIIQCWGMWIFLRKKADGKEFTLYTDVDSQIEHYTKILNTFRNIFILEMICFVIEIFAGKFGSPVFFVFAGFFALVAIGFLQIILKTKQVIAALKERKGEPVPDQGNKQPMALILPGMMLNVCASAITNPGYEGLQILLYVIAIVLMVIGIYQVAKGLSDKK